MWGTTDLLWRVYSDGGPVAIGEAACPRELVITTDQENLTIIESI